MFNSAIESVTGSLTIETALLCTVVSLILGLVIAGSYMLQGPYTKNYVATLVILPAMIQVVIMLVNGNLGTGIAIVGAFSLVRFRSIPGSSREITGIFFSMVIGLATGMGYLTYAALMTVIMGVVLVLLYRTRFGEKKNKENMLKITIPESLDYVEIFDDIFQKYTANHELMRVRTVNLGSMYELNYTMRMKKEEETKAMMDEIRTRNGNLTIICGRPLFNKDEL